MATLSFISAVIVLLYGQAAAQTDCFKQGCHVQYWNERSEYTKPDKIEEYTKLCGKSFNDKCPTCRMLSRYEACVQKSEACKHIWDLSLRSEQKSWSSVCEAPCERMESISQCQIDFFTVNRMATEAMKTCKDSKCMDSKGIKDKVCPAIKAAKTCIGKEAKACPVQAKYASEEVASIADNWATTCDPSCGNIYSFFPANVPDPKQPTCMDALNEGMGKWISGLGEAAKSMQSPVEMCVLAKTPGVDCNMCKLFKQLEACKDKAVGDCTVKSLVDAVEGQFQGFSGMLSALCKPESSPRLFDISEVASVQADAEQSGTTLAWLSFAAFGSLVLVSLGALTYGRCRHGPSAPAGSSEEEDAMLTESELS